MGCSSMFCTTPVVSTGVGGKSFVRYCNADLNFQVKQQYGRQSACCVHVGYMQELVSHNGEVSRIHIHDAVSGRKHEQGLLVNGR